MRPANFRLRDNEELFAQGLPILLYHRIGKCPRFAKGSCLFVSRSMLSQQLHELVQAGFTSADLSEFATNDGNLDRRIAITIDDGFTCAHEFMLPLLQQLRLQSTLFLVADLLGKQNEWDHPAGYIPASLMSVFQVREWLASGQQIGSHTLTHPHLTSLPPQKLREEIVASKKKLEDTFGVAVRHFCYPYGEWNEQIADVVESAGYLTACCTQFGVNTCLTYAYALRRIIVPPDGMARTVANRLRFGLSRLRENSRLPLNVP